jgi:hypothetical protein
VSLAGMANNYVLRTSDKGGKTSHKSLGSRGTPPPAQTLPNVPQGYANQLIRWIPTEALSLYAALGAVVASDSNLSLARSLIIFGVSGVVGIIYVWATAVFKKAAELKIPATRSLWSLFWQRKPVFEIVMATAAFTLWISALPDSWPTHISGWKQQFGAAGVVLAALLIPVVARTSGKTPPAAEVSFE